MPLSLFSLGGLEFLIVGVALILILALVIKMLRKKKSSDG